MDDATRPVGRHPHRNLTRGSDRAEIIALSGSVP